MRPNQLLRGLLCAVLFLSAFFLSACGSSDASTTTAPTGTDRPTDAPAKEGILVEVADVRTAPMTSLYSTSATLRASQQATIAARTRGVIEKLMVEEGGRVRAEQPMAELENGEQKIAAERARAALETTRWNFERSQKLFEQALVSEEAFEITRRELTDAEQAAALAELELGRTIIRAPFGGVVLRRHLDVGNTVSDGAAVYEIANTDELWADVNVPERHIARLHQGQSVQLTADATHAEVEAKIERVAPRVDTDTGTVRVTVAVDGRTAADKGLRPGSFVRVDVVTDTRPEALVVPREALLAEGRRWVIYRVGEDGASVDQIEIAIGFESLHLVEVTGIVDAKATEASRPLQIGDRVVTAGVGALSDKARIEIATESATESMTESAAEEAAQNVDA